MWQAAPLFDRQKDHRVDPGATLFRSGARVTHVWLVRAGGTALTRPLPSGEEAILQRATPGEIVAEASVYAPRYHCDCVATGPTVIARMPVKEFRSALQADPALAEAWAAHLAHSVQKARMRAEIRSLKTVADRLDAWVAEYGDLPAKGQWQDLASELSVSREALYRELARRRT